MNNLEADKGAANLVASEASGGTEGGRGNCDDLAVRRDDVNANAHHHDGMWIGTGDSSTNAEGAHAFKKKNSEFKQKKTKENDLEPPPDLLQLFGDVVRKYTEKSRKRTKASEKKAGKAKVMGKNDTKLFTFAQRRKSYNENIPKKAEKQQHMKEYRREKKVLGVNPEYMLPTEQELIPEY